MSVISDPTTAPANGDRPTAGPRPEPATRPSGAPPTGRDAWLIVMFVLAAGALLLAVLGVGLAVRAIDASEHPSAPSAATPAAAVPSSAMVHLSEFKIDPADVTVATGGTLQVMNMG